MCVQSACSNVKQAGTGGYKLLLVSSYFELFPSVSHKILPVTTHLSNLYWLLWHMVRQGIALGWLFAQHPSIQITC